MECASDNGPDELLNGLESTPNTPVFAATHALYHNLLYELKCPSVNMDIGISKQQQYCCQDVVTKTDQGELI